MQVCKSIEKVQGGYIVEIPFPHANSSDGQKRVCQTWDEVVKLLSRAAQEEPSIAAPTPEASGHAGELKPAPRYDQQYSDFMASIDFNPAGSEEK